jgi:DNA-binding beta-propeller fold protein YncE
MPNDLAVDGSTGEVYVVDSRRNQVRVFTAGGAPLRDLLSKGSAPGQVSFPTGILVDPAGGFLIADHDNTRVQSFTATGALRPPILGGVLSTDAGGLVRPQGIARDALGRIYVADAFRGTVQVFDPGGAHLAFIGDPGKGPGQLALPSDVAVDRFGRLLVTSYDTGKVLVYGLDDWAAPPPETVQARVTLEPRILHPAGRDHSVTAYVEVPGHRPEEIVVQGAALLVSGHRIAAEPRARPGDHDADGVPDLALRFPRRPLVAALGTPGSHQVVLSARLASGEAVEGTGELVLSARKEGP